MYLKYLFHNSREYCSTCHKCLWDGWELNEYLALCCLSRASSGTLHCRSYRSSSTTWHEHCNSRWFTTYFLLTGMFHLAFNPTEAPPCDNLEGSLGYPSTWKYLIIWKAVRYMTETSSGRQNTSSGLFVIPAKEGVVSLMLINVSAFTNGKHFLCMFVRQTSRCGQLLQHVYVLFHSSLLLQQIRRREKTKTQVIWSRYKMNAITGSTEIQQNHLEVTSLSQSYEHSKLSLSLTLLDVCAT